MYGLFLANSAWMTHLMIFMAFLVVSYINMDVLLFEFGFGSIDRNHFQLEHYNECVAKYIHFWTIE